MGVVGERVSRLCVDVSVSGVSGRFACWEWEADVYDEFW